MPLYMFGADSRDCIHIRNSESVRMKAVGTTTVSIKTNALTSGIRERLFS